MVKVDSPDSRTFTAKGIATRERIVEAAAEVLLAEGVSGFNLERVRLSASVSGSQINHYFADRQDLIRAVVKRQIERVLDFHRQPKLGGLDTFEDWERWADLNVRYLRKTKYRGASTYHALTGQLAKNDSATRQIFAEGYVRWMSLLEDSFARMKSRHLLVSTAEPRQMAMTIVALHQGAGILCYTYRQEWPLVEVTRFAVNYVRMFAADPTERIPRSRRRTRGPRGATTHHDVGVGASRFTPKGMATRARIVEGAAELMFERGISGTSLDDVRQAVGVSGSQLSHYFADKQDLIRQVIAARTEFVVGFHEQPKLGQLDSAQSLRDWADLCWLTAGEGYLRSGCVYGSLTGELLEADDEVLDDLAVGYDRWLAAFHRGLSAMRERGDLKPETDPRHLAVALVAAHQGGTLLTHVTASAAPFRTAVGAAVDCVAFCEPTGAQRPERASARSRRTI